MRTTIFTLALCALPAFGQMQDNREPKMLCDDRTNYGNRSNNGTRGEQHCEIKETTIPAISRITVDGGGNGGVTVRGANRSDILIRAKIQTNAPTASEAQSLANEIMLQSAGGNIRYTGPSGLTRRGYSVSYEIFVPHNTSVKAGANNGGISMSDIRGQIEFSTENGGVTLARLAGDVKGRTSNGGLTVELMGDRWEGTQLDAKTTNGGVTLLVPSNYSARLETATVNGSINIDFPITVSGRIGRELNTNIGSGGNLIRATTTNGGVSINRKS